MALRSALGHADAYVRLCAARGLGTLPNKYLNDNYETGKEWWEIKQGLREPASSE